VWGRWRYDIEFFPASIYVSDSLFHEAACWCTTDSRFIGFYVSTLGAFALLSIILPLLDFESRSAVRNFGSILPVFHRPRPRESMFEPIRGGTRGGQAEFKWSDVSADKDREVRLVFPVLRSCPCLATGCTELPGSQYQRADGPLAKEQGCTLVR